MDLVSGHAYWPIKDGLPSVHPSLARDEDCDVAVIGAGITGALLADRLAAEGIDVVVLDKRDVCFGSTAASTALLQYALDTPLCELAERIGPEAAVRAYRLSRAAIDRIEALAGELGIASECGFERRASLYLASTESDVAMLGREVRALERAGFPVEALERADLRRSCSFVAPAAIRLHGNGQVDPYRFSHGLLSRAVLRGARVYDRTSVKRYERLDEGQRDGRVRLRTDRGSMVRARRIVFATGYESQEFLDKPLGLLTSTFAFVTEPLKSFDGWPDRCQIWETARPYFYLRATPDGRAIVGGEDVPFTTAAERDRLMPGKTKALLRRFQAMFPAIGAEIAFAWSGTFGESHDGLAHVGAAPDWPDVHFALGYGGNGITFAAVAAEIIADRLCGRDNPDAELFRLGRR